MTEERSLSLLLTALVVAAAVPTLGLGSAAAAPAASGPTTFHVKQGAQCYDVQALGDGSQSVESFYDYRNNETHPNQPQYWTYSSYGTTDLQENQASKLFIYNGTDGYSLVFLHDKLAKDGGDGSNASTITFTMTGMDNGTWVVQDDTYGNDTQDDNWDKTGDTHQVDWMWGSNRTDGGAFQGIEGETITIDPDFNEAAAEWGNWAYSGDAQNETDAWDLVNASGSEQSLVMDQNVTVATGSCSDSGGEDTTDPSAALSASPNPAANNEEVTLDASNSTDDGGSGIAEYVWDFDGDGVNDTTTTGPTTTHTYTATGEYNASVTVVDGNNNTDTANTTVEVTESSGPVVSITHPKTVNVNETFEVWANATNESKVEGYEWDFGSTTKTGKKVTHSYAQAGNYEVTVNWTESDGDSESATFTIEAVANESGSPNESITYLNGSAVRVNGTFERVEVNVGFYGQTGLGSSFKVVENVSGSTVITADEAGVNGSMINLVSAYKEYPADEPDLKKEHPRLDYYAETIEPLHVTVSLENVTKVSNGTYEVTFGYDNPNDEALTMRDSTLSGNVSGDAPREVQPGEHTFTVTWTPDNPKNYLTWTLNRSNFDQSDVKTSTPPARVLDGDGNNSSAPKAAVSVPGTAPLSETFVIDARNSTDDNGIVWYKYYVDGKLLWAGNPEHTPAMTEVHPWREAEFPHGPGTYDVTVKVWDADGQSDKATKSVTIEKRDHEDPTATITVEGTKEVGEEVTFTATDFSEAPDTLTHIYWRIDSGDSTYGPTKTTTFQKSGKHTVTLVLKDRAGNYNEVHKTIHVAEKSSDGGDNGNNNGGNTNPGQGGFTGGDTTDSKQDGIGTADPKDQSASKPLTEIAGPVGSVTFQPADSAEDSGVELMQTAPKGVEVPTAAANGFEAISYLDVTGAQQVTFSVSKAKLTDMGASAEDIALFRYDDGSWTAVETTVVNETSDAFRVRANATDGVFAVGVERAATGVTDLSVSSQQVEAGDTVTITATVENTGRADGEHEVTLSVGGEEVATKTVSVGAGETATVTFDRTFDSSGTYEVSVGDASANVVVESVETQTSTADESDEGSSDETTTDDGNNGSGIPGFGVGVSLVALLAAALLALRQR